MMDVINGGGDPNDTGSPSAAFYAEVQVTFFFFVSCAKHRLAEALTLLPLANVLFFWPAEENPTAEVKTTMNDVSFPQLSCNVLFLHNNSFISVHQCPSVLIRAN